MGIGHAFGKTILFGEHFVVHGYPAIVSGLSNKIVARVKKAPDNVWRFTHMLPAFPAVPPLSWKVAEPALKIILKHLGINQKLHIAYSGDLRIAHSGMGSSAANCVAFARAISDEFGLSLTNKQINHAAFLGEQDAHGTPSGIDNTAATYGGTLLFQSGTMSPITVNSSIPIVLADSKKQTKTHIVVDAVHTLKKERPEVVQTIFDQYTVLIQNAQVALRTFNLEALGSLMNKNHELLQQLTVSCKQLDRMVEIARGAGALGAKLTGTGRGGLILALAPDKKIQKIISHTLEHAGYATLMTSIT